MRCFIRHNVTARDLWILISAQQLTQKKVGEYLMFFQNNTRSQIYYCISQNFSDAARGNSSVQAFSVALKTSSTRFLFI